MPYCNESVTEHVKCINFYLKPLFGIVKDLAFQFCKNFCNIFRNEHTGSVYAQLFSLIHPHRCKPFQCVTVDVCKKRRNDAFEFKKITKNNNSSQYKIIIYNLYM
jgi:hypothetical protein